MHQSFATGATLGLRMCPGLEGLSTMILPLPCPGSAKVVWDFCFPTRYSQGSSSGFYWIIQKKKKEQLSMKTWCYTLVKRTRIRRNASTEIVGPGMTLTT